MLFQNNMEEACLDVNTVFLEVRRWARSFCFVFYVKAFAMAIAQTRDTHESPPAGSVSPVAMCRFCLASLLLLCRCTSVQYTGVTASFAGGNNLVFMPHSLFLLMVGLMVGQFAAYPFVETTFNV